MIKSSFKDKGTDRDYRNFRNKKILLADWDSGNRLDNFSQTWHPPFKKIFGKVITFSPKKNYFIYGKKIMNQMFLELVKKEKPDFIFSLPIYDEFDPSIFVEIKKNFPKLKIISYHSDASYRFEDFYRNYSLFSDGIISPSPESLSFYKKEHIKDIVLSFGINSDFYRPLNLKKKYEVIFIGRPSYDRVDYLRFLIKNGVKLNIWGDGWMNYSEFKKIYRGILPSEDWPKVVSQSKINLSFSIGGDGKPQRKGIPLEAAACKSFSLVGYCKDYLNIFDKNEIVMFKNKKDLLKKIKYYLVHDGEREKIAEAAYRKIKKKGNIESDVYKLLKKIKNQKKHEFLTSTFKKVKYVSVLDFEDRNIKNKLRDYSYVCFKIDAHMHPLKDYLQSYSLEKSGEDISCCDYYVNSPALANYLLFKSKQSFMRIGNKANHLINPAQLMIKKHYFLKNLDLFKNLLEGRNAEAIKNNAVFVSIPLVEVKEVKTLSVAEMEDSFQMKFLDNLYSLYSQKKFIALHVYLINLINKALNGKRFLLIVLKRALTDKRKLNKLKQI